LEARESGSVQIEIPEDEKKAQQPALFEITSIADPRGLNPLEGVVESSELRKLTKQLFLITEWPFQITLVKGAYEVRIFRGSGSEICKIEFNITPDKKIVRQCQPIILKKGVASNNLTAVDLASPVVKDNLAVMFRALDVKGLSLKLIEEEEFKSQDSSRVFLRKIIETDSKTGVSLSLFPADNKLLKSWQKFKNASKKKGLERFAVFAHDFAPLSILELSCPSESISVMEYKRMIQLMQPNALQLYGCGGAQRRGRLAALFAELSVQDTKPLLVTSVSGLSSDWNRSHFPYLFVEHRKDFSSKTLSASLNSGDFYISSGSFLEVKDLMVLPTSKLISGKKRSFGHSKKLKINFVASIKPDHNVTPTELKIYNEHGIVTQMPIKLKKGQASDVPIQLNWINTGKWLRVELFGRIEASKYQKDQALPLVLASSNYFPLKRVFSETHVNKKEL